MPKTFEIIDLFAGPGGLGEGFAQAGAAGKVPMRIGLSVEMDDHAVQTLRLRSFLRGFEAFPEEYYTAIENGQGMPDWSELHPSRWKEAQSEVRQRVLGAEGVFEELAVELDRVREAQGGNTILIGGPPCQAYSLAGRSRNKGKADYVAEEDQRHYLYREYVRILSRLKPAVFVMENVKGMLSSKVDGGGIFSRVLSDLETAGDGYVLLPLAKPIPMDGTRAAARDFLIRSEDHGVPQARHRVIILGIRSDLAHLVPRGETLLGEPQTQVGVLAATSGLMRLRSGLSRGDSASAWCSEVRKQATRIAEYDGLPEALRAEAAKIALHSKLPENRQSSWLGAPPPVPEALSTWLTDPRLRRVAHHDSRGHMADDLGRYIYSALWTKHEGRAPKLAQFPDFLQPAHRNRETGDFSDRFRTQAGDRPATTVTSHISKDGNYFIHPDPVQCRSLTVREAARLQTFPDNYYFCGTRTIQYHQVGNAVPPYLAYQIAMAVQRILSQDHGTSFVNAAV